MSITTNEHPILFSGPMVRAIREGRKTQTRRVIKSPKIHSDHGSPLWNVAWVDGEPTNQYLHLPYSGGTAHRVFSPYGVPGDRLIVRESWRYFDWTEDGEPQIQYQADGELRWIDLSDVPEETIEKIHHHWAELSDSNNFAREGAARDKSWRPSIHMFHCFSRFRPVVKRVLVERVQEISPNDAVAEGIECVVRSTEPEYGVPGLPPAFRDYSGRKESCIPRDSFMTLWDSINADRGHGWDTNPWVWCVEFERVEGER